MKIKKLIAAALLVTAISSCKKEHITQTVTTKKLVKIEDAEYPVNSATFTYDAAGRLTGYETADYTRTYTFSADKVDYKRFLKTENRNDFTGTVKLNANGFANTADITYYPTANTSSAYQQVYEYNTDGYGIKKTTVYAANNSSLVANEFTNGNLTKQTYSTNGMVSGSWKYTYSNMVDKNGITDQFFDYNNIHLGGLGNKNLVSKAEQYDGANQKYFEIQYEYVMDNDGYPVKITSHYITNNKDYHSTYFYNK